MKNALAVVNIGYKHFGFEKMEDAIAFFRMAGQSIPLDTHYGKLPNGREGVSWIRDEAPTLGLEQISLNKVEIQHTLEELKQRAESKADVEGHAEVVGISDAPREIEYAGATTASDAPTDAEERQL